MSKVTPSPPLVGLEHRREHIALVTIQRPDVRNAVNGAMAIELERIVQSTEADPEIWAVVLTGAGDKAFCAGADLKEVAEGRIATLWTPDSGFAGFVNAARDKPWIAAVNGLALAGGFELALACDFIVASDDAAFGLPEVTRGMLAAAGGAYRLPRVLPRALALELIATGRRLDAPQALALHLVNRVVPKAQTVEEALALAAEICKNAPVAVRESLRIARRTFDLDDASLSERSAAAQARLILTEDFQEGPRAFVEKRPARWRGC
jgi:enoyl-CoA hydratase/carnithine racemase